MIISRDMARGEREGKRRLRERGSTGGMDAMDGGEMADKIEVCGEKEEKMDTVMGNTEISGKLVMVLGRDTSKKLEVRGQIEPDEAVVGVGHTISRMLTQQKTYLFLDVSGKRSTEKMLCHQDQELEID